jgi:integrase
LGWFVAADGVPPLEAVPRRLPERLGQARDPVPGRAGPQPARRARGRPRTTRPRRARRSSKRKDQGESVRPSKLLFGEYAEEWHAALTQRDPTLDAYRYALDKHLLPRFRTRKLAALSTDDVAKLIAEMRAQGYAGWTIRGTLTCLSAMYRKAVRKKLVNGNPVAGLEKNERPKVARKRKRILSEKEIGTLLGAAGNHRALIAVFLFTGVRLSEALGLRWEDIDFDGGFVRCRYQLSRKRELVELKSDAGLRLGAPPPPWRPPLPACPAAARVDRRRIQRYANVYGEPARQFGQQPSPTRVRRLVSLPSARIK